MQLEFDRYRETSSDPGEPTASPDSLLAELKGKKDADDENTDVDENSVPGETEPAGDDQPATEETDGDDPELALESVQRTDVFLATESFTDTTRAIFGAAIDGVTYLGKLGVSYAPGVLGALYRGVLSAIVGISKLFYNSAVALNRFIVRRANSETKLKSDIAKYREAFSMVSENPNPDPGTFDKPKLSSLLVSVGKTNIAENIAELTAVVNGPYSRLLDGVINDVGATSRIVSEFNVASYRPDPSLLRVRVPSDFKEGKIQGDAELPDDVEGFVLPVVMPGAKVLAFRRPIDSPDSVAMAYQHAQLTLVFDAAAYLDVQAGPCLALSEVGKILDNVEQLLQAAGSLEQKYKRIMQRKADMRQPLRLYFNKLITSKNRVRMAHSMLDVVYLKTSLIDKTYLVGSIEFHDYIVGVISDSLKVVDYHLRAYMSK